MTGRPLKLLSDAVEEAILDAIRYGATIEAACAAAGIATSTYRSWMARGREAQETLEETDELPDSERPFLSFLAAAMRAHAQGEVANVRRIDRVADGGYVIKTRTRRMRDPATGDLVEETETDIAPPDWRAAAWILERRHRETFGKEAAALEISGPDGGPVEMAGGPKGGLEALAARVSANLAAHRAEMAEREAAEAVDAEVVE
ncbi:MAG: putative phage protein [Massilia sp.]|nr:putative phage protein [Massilia sp.]